MRFLGISVNDHDPATALRAVAAGMFDTVQVIYNIFDQSPEASSSRLPRARRGRAGARALRRGRAHRRHHPDTRVPRGRLPQPLLRRRPQAAGAGARRGVLQDARHRGGQLPEIALRFCSRQPAVSTVIPGMRSVRNVERNMAIGDGQGLPAEQVEKLRETPVGARLLLGLLLAVLASFATPASSSEARDFPRGFLWGTAIAGFQTEMGGRPANPTRAATGGRGRTTGRTSTRGRVERRLVERGPGLWRALPPRRRAGRARPRSQRLPLRRSSGAGSSRARPQRREPRRASSTAWPTARAVRHYRAELRAVRRRGMTPCGDPQPLHACPLWIHDPIAAGDAFDGRGPGRSAPAELGPRRLARPSDTVREFRKYAGLPGLEVRRPRGPAGSRSTSRWSWP